MTLNSYYFDDCQIWTCDNLREVVYVKRLVGSRWALRPKKERSKSEGFLNGRLLTIPLTHTHTRSLVCESHMEHSIPCMTHCGAHFLAHLGMRVGGF